MPTAYPLFAPLPSRRGNWPKARLLLDKESRLLAFVSRHGASAQSAPMSASDAYWPSVVLPPTARSDLWCNRYRVSPESRSLAGLTAERSPLREVRTSGHFVVARRGSILANPGATMSRNSSRYQ